MGLRVSQGHFERTVQRGLDLFNNTGNEMMDKGSQTRSYLMKLTLKFNHHNNELHALHSGGQWQTHSRMKMPDAKIFWETMFPGQMCVVAGEFMDKFREVQEKGWEERRGQLQQSIDMCEDNSVSWWEFDIFATLFQPWDRLLQVWHVITTVHPGYRAWSTYEQIKQTLRPHLAKPGSYVFRLSVTRPGSWAIGFVHPGGRVLQAIPEGKSLYQALIDGQNDGTYLYPDGNETNVDLREHMSIRSTDEITVTAEENEIYARVDSKFETCKICHANDKDYKIEPCGHLLCRDCFDDWSKTQKSATVCPFCRGPIQNSSRIVVRAYSAGGGSGGGGSGGGDHPLPPTPSIGSNTHRNSFSSASGRMLTESADDSVLLGSLPRISSTSGLRRGSVDSAMLGMFNRQGRGELSIDEELGVGWHESAPEPPARRLVSLDRTHQIIGRASGSASDLAADVEHFSSGAPKSMSGPIVELGMFVLSAVFRLPPSLPPKSTFRVR
jgi:E3 ubiquitin-protein ligase CBL